MDENEKWFVERLSKPGISEAEVSGSIDALEVLLSVDALSSLVKLLGDLSRSNTIREQAAKAIYKIGANYVLKDLFELEKSASPEIKKLVSIAMGKSGVA